VCLVPQREDRAREDRARASGHEDSGEAMIDRETATLLFLMALTISLILAFVLYAECRAGGREARDCLAAIERGARWLRGDLGR
jgi:hypothetical protein